MADLLTARREQFAASISAEAGKPIAAYVNYALHLDTTGGMLFSADYSYMVGKVLRETWEIPVPGPRGSVPSGPTAAKTPGGREVGEARSTVEAG